MRFSFIDTQNANDSYYHLNNDALWSSGQCLRIFGIKRHSVHFPLLEKRFGVTVSLNLHNRSYTEKCHNSKK